MININNEKSLALDAQERYDIISFAMDAADDNGFINSFIFERALYCYAAIMLYPEQKDSLSQQVAANLVQAWSTMIQNGLFEKMIDEFGSTLETLSEEAEKWYQEYSDWAHSARGILNVVQQFSGDIVQNAAARLTGTAQETGVNELLEIADEWGMTRDVFKTQSQNEKEIIEDSLFE